MKTLSALLDDLTRDGWQAVSEAFEVYRDHLAGWLDAKGPRIPAELKATWQRRIELLDTLCSRIEEQAIDEYLDGKFGGSTNGFESTAAAAEVQAVQRQGDNSEGGGALDSDAVGNMPALPGDGQRATPDRPSDRQDASQPAAPAETKVEAKPKAQRRSPRKKTESVFDGT